jgi:hypothetical protein
VYQGKDDEWTGLGLYRAQHISLASCPTRVRPLALPPRSHLRQQLYLFLFSVTTPKPLSPHREVSQATTPVNRPTSDSALRLYH